MGKKVFFLALTINLILPVVFAATPPKAGSSCAKVGITQNYLGKKYTCIKNGKKFVWDKGVVTKQTISQTTPSAVPSSSPTPIPTPTPSASFTPENEKFTAGLLEQDYAGYFADDINFFKKPSASSRVTFRIDFQEGHDGKYQFSKQWSGYFIPSSTGYWKFTVTSDDASYLWLGQSALTSLTANSALLGLPFVHGPMTTSSPIYLKEEVAYPIRIVYGNDINFAQMTVRVTTPKGVEIKDLGGLVRHKAPTNSTEDGILPGLQNISISGKFYPVSQSVWRDQPRDNVSLAIQAILDNAQLQNQVFVGKLTWFFQGVTSAEIEVKTKRGLMNGVNLFTKLGFNTTDALVINARDMNWLKTELTNLGCQYGSLPDFPGFYVPRSCQGNHGAVTAQHWEVAKVVGGLDGLPFNHVLSHEYFHQIQEELSGTTGNGPFPLWYWEGGAHFFTLLAFSSWNTERYYEQWAQDWFESKSSDQKSSCVSVNIFEMNNNESGTNRSCGYTKGSIIVEYFVSRFGIEKYASIISLLGSSPQKRFADVFREVTSVDLNSFYLDANTFLKSRGWAQ